MRDPAERGSVLIVSVIAMTIAAALADPSVIEARLRERYLKLWADVGRELDKHDQQQHEDLVQGAGDAEDDATANLVVDRHRLT